MLEKDKKDADSPTTKAFSVVTISIDKYDFIVYNDIKKLQGDF